MARRNESRSTGASTLQLFGLVVLASSGVIVSSIVFHWDKLYQDFVRQTELMDSMLYKESITSIKQQQGRPHQQQVNSQQLSREELLEKCTSLNSKEWLEQDRVGNTRESNMSDQMVLDMILQSPSLSYDPFLLRQTICHKNSRFLNWTDDGSEGNTSLHYWSLRLMYLSYFHHQHAPAQEEARIRQSYPECVSILQEKYQVGSMDYECPGTKFLVVPMGEMGLGAVMRLGAVNALVAGVATNRTVLLVNNLEDIGDKSLHKPWVHASCPRGDIQCFFMPPTPCTITKQEIDQGRMLVRGEARRLFKFGEIPEGHEDDRVIVCNFVLRPKHVPETFPNSMQLLADSIVERYNPLDLRVAVMRQALTILMEPDPTDDSRPYYYFAAASRVHHAALFYSMRPNYHYAQKLDSMMQQIIPESFNPELSFGLPIRASDKCLTESECLSFPQYMRLMSQTYGRHQGMISVAANGDTNPLNSIVLTTESKSILSDMHRFEDNQTLRATVPFSYRFVTNDHDVMQSTGLPENFMKKTADHIAADDIMLSAVSSLKAQLMAKYTVGNCCSNFHLLLFDFLRDGCGAARDNVGQCLQENDDPEFRVCCMWSKTDECVEKGKKKKEREEAAKKEKEKLQKNKKQRAKL